MVRISRPAAIAMWLTAAACTGTGLWLQSSGGPVTPPTFLQYAAVAVGTGGLGAFILWHRPHNRYGAVHLAMGVLFGTVVLAAGVLSRAGTPAALPQWVQELALAWSWLAVAPLLPLWVVVIAGFPDGRFHRTAVTRAVVALAVAVPLLVVVGYLLAPAELPPLIRLDLPAALVGPLAPVGGPHVLYRVAWVALSALGTFAPMAAVMALVDRFRTAGPVLRQQIKWLLAGAAVSVVVQAVPVQALESEALRTAAQVLRVLAVPLPLAAAGVAIFKHGLWEIDVVISKGLVYALASAVLTALFLGVAFIAGVTVAGRDSRVVAALGLALLVSFAAQPLRQRLERLVARVLYGEEPRGLMALARLGDTARSPQDPRELGPRIADAARTALGASWAGVWLAVGGEGSSTLRQVGASGVEPGPSAVVPPRVPAVLHELIGGVTFADLPLDVAAALRPLFADEPVLVAPLATGDSIIGLIACGPRPKDAFTGSDLELLSIVARESALALRNISLEEELRQRLEQIEQQAAALHSSRQRLVTAQDQERRRIERDLHDGAQQQLVALAAGLRRAAHADRPALDRILQELADEAEDAVFTLQELGRGIYPSLLADRGLQAALQAHAARLPAHVRVEVDPVMHGRRLEPELEAAFYFVGLEAMTNAVKHAPGARIIISLRGDRQTGGVTLEVHDDGPGFPTAASASGTGLQNMADRIGAFGGVLSVDSVPGGGTWVRAVVALEAEITDISRRASTP